MASRDEVDASALVTLVMVTETLALMTKKGLISVLEFREIVDRTSHAIELQFAPSAGAERHVFEIAIELCSGILARIPPGDR